MKKFLQRNKFLIFITILVIGWYCLLQLVSDFSFLVPLRKGFLGPVSWANFDGAHYLIISKFNYGTYEQAFFPLFPLLIHLTNFVFLRRTDAAFFIVNISFLSTYFIFIKLSLLDMKKDKVFWALLFLLLFPTSFYLVSIYTEPLFLAITLGSFYAMRKNNFFLASLLAGLASATRVVGIFLLPAILVEYFYKRLKKDTGINFSLRKGIEIVFISTLSLSGLLGYLGYLWIKYHDPLLFVHSQPHFGTQKTVDTIILLPQVVYRYIKIFISVPVFTQSFGIALLEFVSFFFFLGILLFFWKKIRLSYLIFSLCAILFPTITGTLNSEPRYVLAAFPVFMLLGNSNNKVMKILMLLLFIPLLIILCAYFLRGYFIA